MIIKSFEVFFLLFGALNAITPTDRECSSGEECTHRDNCLSFQDSLAEFNQLSKEDSEYSSTLEDLKGLVCNNKQKGVCCSCPEKRCVTVSSCSALTNTKNDLEGHDAQKKTEAIKKLQSLICNKAEKKVCCPPSMSTFSASTTAGDLSDPSAIPREGQCGKLYERGKFIVGGVDTEAGEFPFAALLGYTRKRSLQVGGVRKTFNENSWFCGGILINRWYILTAAHCHVEGSTKSFITRARLGEWTVGFEELDFPPHQDFDIRSEDIIKHNDFEHIPKKNVFNDIALVKLPRMVELNQGVQPVCLPAFKEEYQKYFQEADFEASTKEEKGTVVGWGFTKYDPFDYNPLQKTKSSRVATKTQQKLEVPILRNRVCGERWGGFLTPISSQVCAGGEPGKDSCKGDSGGGLFLQRTDKDPWYLLGLVSFGSQLCGSGSPAVYTRVFSFLPWLVENLK